MIAYSPNSTAHLICGERTTSGTIITIPAGSVWCGTIQIAASVTLAATATPRVVTAGTGVTPAAGQALARLSLTGLALTTIADSDTIEAIVMAPAENSVTLEFNTGGASSASVVCNGFIL